MRRLPNALVTVVVVALCLPLAGCGGKDSGGDSPAVTQDGKAIASSDTPASRLRARLTALLTDHVYLAGDAVTQTIRRGDGSPEASAATAALDANAAALAKTFGAIYGAQVARQFEALWRRHDGLLVDYAQGRAAADEAAVQRALAQLDAYRLEFGDFLAKVNPKLKSAKVSEDLKGHIETLAAAIDAIVARSPDAAAKLATAAEHMPMTAALLAGGIVAQDQERFSGATNAGGAALRASLTGLLTTDAHLSLLAADATIGAPAGSRPVSAAKALDDNATTLSETISSVYGEEAGQGFLKVWRRRAAAFASYTKAKLADDPAAATAALGALDDARSALVTQLAVVDPQLQRRRLTAALERSDAALTAAIRAAVADSPKRFMRVADASAAAAVVAAALARGITLQFPEKFTAE